MKYREPNSNNGLKLHRVFSHRAGNYSANKPFIIKCDEIKKLVRSVIHKTNKFLPQAQIFIEDIIGILPRKEREAIKELPHDQQSHALMDYLKRTPDFCLSFNNDGRLAQFCPLNDRITDLRFKRSEILVFNSLAI